LVTVLQACRFADARRCAAIATAETVIEVGQVRKADLESKGAHACVGLDLNLAPSAVFAVSYGGRFGSGNSDADEMRWRLVMTMNLAGDGGNRRLARKPDIGFD